MDLVEQKRRTLVPERWATPLARECGHQTPIVDQDWESELSSRVEEAVFLFIDRTPFIGDEGLWNCMASHQPSLAAREVIDQHGFVEKETELEPSWVPDVLSVFASDLLVESVSASLRTWIVHDTTPIVPSRTAYNLLLPILRFSAPATTITDRQLRLMQTALLPKVLRLSTASRSRDREQRQYFDHKARSDHPKDRRTREANEAVAALGDWLLLTREEVAELAGIAPRTMAYWLSGKVPRASSVRKLLEVHSLVRSLVRRLGADGAREWLAAPSSADTTRRRLQVLQSDDGPAKILREAAGLLFPATPDRLTVRPEFEEGLSEELPPANPDMFRGAPRRVRRPRPPNDEGKTSK